MILLSCNSTFGEAGAQVVVVAGVAVVVVAVVPFVVVLHDEVVDEGIASMGVLSKMGSEDTTGLDVAVDAWTATRNQHRRGMVLYACRKAQAIRATTGCDMG